MMRTFVALKNFESAETRSAYAQGLSYTIKEGNRYLNALAEVWVLEGKIRFSHDPTASEISGKGYVEPTGWHKTKAWWDRIWQ